MLTIAVKAARRAGNIINRASLDIDKLTITSKNHNDFVSEVDRAAEDAIIEILLESYHRGYFDHPRRINAGELAEEMGMHKTTLLEHIHKAEKRLIGHILAQGA